MVYGLESARHFVLGCDNLVVATDHKPLLVVLNNRHLGDIKNERLLSLKEKTLPYRFSINHIPGQKQKAPDANSRKLTGDAKKLPLDSDFEESDSVASIEPRLRLPEATMTWEPDTSADLEEKLANAAATNPGDIRAVTWAEVREHTPRNENLQNFQKKIEDGFQGITSRLDLAPGIREFFQFKDGLSTVDGVILYNNRIVIPSPLRALILDTMYSAHQGVSCMTSRAESSVFWPGITPAIANLRAPCRSCKERAPSQPHGPPLAAQEPVYPFQCICADYFKYKGCNYMVVVDRSSGWPIVQQSRVGSSGLVKCLREFFVTYGIADELSSDGGPEFTAEETQQLLSNWGVHHHLSLLHLPTQMVAPSSGSRPASACSWTTLARTARSTSTNFKEACFNTATPLTAIPVYPQHK